MDIYRELLVFYEGLKLYKELLSELYYKAFIPQSNRNFNSPYDKDLIKRDEIIQKIEKRREYIVRLSGRMIPIITEIINGDTIEIYEMGKPRSVNIWTMGLREEFDYRTAETLNACIDNTNRTISKLEADIEAGLRDKKTGILITQQTKAAIKAPKAFIAHGGDSPALSKLKSFLEALGVEPLVVEEQPSEGRSVGENVDWYARQADCAVILATKGDIDGKTGRFIPRGNVLIEIGKSQELFKDRIVYLLQAGTKFPTNISEKVWGRFTTQRMDDAFIKIAKELTNWGFITAGITKE